MGAGAEAATGSGNNSSRKQSANIVNDGQNTGPPDYNPISSSAAAANTEQDNIKASSSAVDLKIQETAEAILELKSAAGNQLQ